MKNALLLLAILIASALPAAAQSAADGLDTTLVAYYRWCNRHKQDPEMLLKADTMFRLAGERQNPRMQSVALCLKADYYYFTDNYDSLKVWVARTQQFTREHDQPTHYYFVWTRLISYYSKYSKYTLAQYELEQYMSQAEKDNYKPATAEAYKQLGHIYRTRGSKKPAVEYYRKAIDFIIQNGLNTFHLSNLATMLMDLQRYPEAAEAVEKGKACIPLPDYIWGLKAKETHLLAQTGQTDKAKALFNEIKAGQNGNLSEIKLAEIEVAIYNHSHEYGKMIAAIDKLIRSFEREGYKESYFYYLYENRAAAYAALGNFEAAYRDIQHYTELYHKQVNDDNEKTLGEFATLLDVNRLNMEKAELRQQAQEERLLLGRPAGVDPVLQLHEPPGGIPRQLRAALGQIDARVAAGAGGQIERAALFELLERGVDGRFRQPCLLIERALQAARPVRVERIENAQLAVGQMHFQRGLVIGAADQRLDGVIFMAVGHGEIPPFRAQA